MDDLVDRGQQIAQIFATFRGDRREPHQPITRAMSESVCNR
jgi:hypothetical protein